MMTCSAPFKLTSVLKPKNMPMIWPRGFPLNRLMSCHPSWKMHCDQIELASIGVIQTLCDKDPNVDTVYRLTRSLPVHFRASQELLLCPGNAYSPYTVQAPYQSLDSETCKNSLSASLNALKTFCTSRSRSPHHEGKRRSSVSKF